MKIAIVGAGRIGGTLGELLAGSKHRLFFGVRGPVEIDQLAAATGAQVGSALEAAEFGEIVVFACPYGAWTEFAQIASAPLVDKAVIDAANPYRERDGAIAEEALKSGHGSGTYTQSLLPRSRVVKAFNTIYWADLRDKSTHTGKRIAMPMAGDDAHALSLAAEVAHSAGFDPLVVGPLSRSALLDPGSSIYAKSYTALQVRRALGLPQS